MSNELLLTIKNLRRFWDNCKSMLGTAGGIATLDEHGKVPPSQLPSSTATYETIIIYATFDESTGQYTIDEESAAFLRGYAGEKTMYLYEPLGKLYIPYVGNNEFVIDVFGASIYFHVDPDTLLCTFSIGEWVSLDENGEISPDKMPDLVIAGYYDEDEGLFYEDDEQEVFIAGDHKKLFVDISTGNLYSYHRGKYYPVVSSPNIPQSSNVKYMSDEDYESMMEELGI